ncbi:MAG: class I SAM-dependent methyltransferase [Sphingobacteriaceae bacterium]|nr:class I SAM-dependent methyltransferase [Cytophagaceae bacterium]
MDLHSVETFFDTSWNVYDLVLNRNYMFHREIYAEVLNQLRAFEAGKYTMLDLGCGSARFLAPVLAQHPPLRYVGVDLSATALAEAGPFLRPQGFAVELQQGDLLEYIRQTPPKSFDVVFAGFAIHHLLEAEKQAFFQHAHRALKPNGILLMADVVRYEDETSDVYLARYVQNLKTTWTALSAPQTEDVVEHILGQDYPEKPSTLTHMAQQANFVRSEELNRFGHHATWRFDA